MKTYVITYNIIEGIHFWKDAKEPVEYLKNPHRHNFVIRSEFEVNSDDREIEIIIQQNKIKDFFKEKYGYPAMFNEMSCEMIAKDILHNFKNCK